LQDDIRKHLKKTHPEVPAGGIRAVCNALLRTGLLLHKDGNPIRSSKAPFELEKNAEELNDALTTVYLGVLQETEFDMTNTGMLAELFLGDADRRRKIEETLAWISAPDEDDLDDSTVDDDDGPSQSIPDDIDLDDLLSMDDDVLLQVSDESDDDLLKVSDDVLEVSDDVLEVADDVLEVSDDLLEVSDDLLEVSDGADESGESTEEPIEAAEAEPELEASANVDDTVDEAEEAPRKPRRKRVRKPAEPTP
jgi:hypothetical protein